MKFQFLIPAAIAAFVLSPALAQNRQGPERWEEDIAAFEEADRDEAPATGGIVFVGSSSIRRWDLEKWFPDLKLINRGFGGSQIADSTHYSDRFIAPLQPKTVVIYAGDNDLNSGKTPENVAADFGTFVAKVRWRTPAARVVFIGIKPSIRRWHLIEDVRKANALIQAACSLDERLIFIDTDAAMIGEDGQPKAELFVDDGLHLSDEGYRLWTELVRPALE